MNKAEKPGKHGRDHDLGGEDPAPHRTYRNIKVFADRNALDGNLPDEAIVVSTGDGKFIFEIDEDEGWEILRSVDDKLELVYVRIYVSVAGGGTLIVQLRNITKAVDMLSTRVQIDAGEKSSKTSSVPYVINPSNREVDDGDQIAVDVDSDGSGAEGLGVNVGFAPG